MKRLWIAIREFSFVRRCGMHEMPPRYHRLAYDDMMHNCGVTAVFGLHWILRGFRRAIEWSWQYRSSRFEDLIWDAKEQGRKEANEEWQDRMSRMEEKFESLRKGLA